MEPKARIFSVLLLFLLLASPCFSTGRLHVKIKESEVYVIDYRGPETHTYLPPLNQGHDSSKAHRHTTTVHHKPRFFKAQINGKEVHV